MEWCLINEVKFLDIVSKVFFLKSNCLSYMIFRCVAVHTVCSNSMKRVVVPGDAYCDELFV